MTVAQFPDLKVINFLSSILKKVFQQPYQDYMQTQRPFHHLCCAITAKPTMNSITGLRISSNMPIKISKHKTYIVSRLYFSNEIFIEFFSLFFTASTLRCIDWKWNHRHHLFVHHYTCNCNYISSTKLPWSGDNEGTFRSSSQIATCPPVYHTQWRLHIVLLIAKRHISNIHRYDPWAVGTLFSLSSPIQHGLVSSSDQPHHVRSPNYVILKYTSPIEKLCKLFTLIKSRFDC